ncbi:MAG: hypothetical protein RL189_245, partial [Pseudomonadota bacterium]
MTLQHQEIHSLIGRLSSEQRAGLFVWPSLAAAELTAEEESLLKLYKPSGVVLFRRSMKTLAQTRHLCDR